VTLVSPNLKPSLNPNLWSPNLEPYTRDPKLWSPNPTLCRPYTLNPYKALGREP